MLLAIVTLVATTAAGAEPYVTVYRDDAVAFQVRRDRITQRDGIYTVWLRWLWAEPRRWKSQDETARVAIANVDCARLRVRELGILHKDRDAKIIEAEEPEHPPWQSFEEDSGAAATMKRLCEFLPKLAAESNRDSAASR